jgi:hypothetical protein
MAGIVFNREMFKKVKTIIAEVAASTTASVANNTLLSVSSTTYDIGENFVCTIQCTTGYVWINPIGVATTNSFKMEEGTNLELQVSTGISFISDSTTAKIQGIIWEV